jgi:hypothetical protein
LNRWSHSLVGRVTRGDLSSRAAWRLESLGFAPVYRYAAGKRDWFAFDLPMEGELAAVPKASNAARRDVPACQLGEPVGEVYQRCQDLGWNVCLVVNEQNILMGRLRGKAWHVDPDTPVEEVMENGPTTFRPDNFLEPLIQRMHDKKVGTVIITNPDGVLLGILYRKDGDERLKRDKSTIKSKA